MSGYVQMLEGLDDVDGFNDLGSSEPPALLVSTFQTIVSTPEIRGYLRALGRAIARKGLGDLTAMVAGKPSPPSPWLDGLLMPLLAPVEEGIMDVLKAKARPWAIGLAALTGLGGIGLGALIASRRRRLYERGRRDATAVR